MVNETKTYTLSILVENKPGVLTRVTGLFARRAFNIHSLAVGTTEDVKVSRITIVTDESQAPIEQITLQLQKLINVLKVQILDSAKSVHREIVLIKVNTRQGKDSVRPEVIGVANLFRVKVVDVAAESITIEATGKESKLEALVQALLPYEILEIVRSGTIAISRGRDIINLHREFGENNL
ncbi:MAG: acetolactate synthase small subunit [Candidatus Ancillula sp.]|jgi:acetolactate synthase-1/3 small subunit|nr:acetolactate synthase small subunit [Candidatus Ancillula sp.]